jgi:2-iminobutanoate/2-iminopropanoate deaminase
MALVQRARTAGEDVVVTRSSVDAAGAPAPVGPYSHAVAAAGEVVYLSGQTPIDPASGRLVAGDVSVQVRQVFANLEQVLVAAGLTFDAVVKVNVFLVDMADFSAMNSVYGSVFEAPYPARTTVAVAGLPLGARVEIELVAVRPQDAA